MNQTVVTIVLLVAFAGGCRSSAPPFVITEAMPCVLDGRVQRSQIKDPINGETGIIWVLNLDQPCSVRWESPETSGVWYTNANVTHLQMVLDATEYKRYLGLVEKNVRVWGTLFPGNTRYHHTDILMDTDRIEAR